MALYGLSKSTILREIKKGNLPSPIKLTARTSAWKVEDIRKHLDSIFTENRELIDGGN